jgi:hypothetical protein
MHRDGVTAAGAQLVRLARSVDAKHALIVAQRCDCDELGILG